MCSLFRGRLIGLLQTSPSEAKHFSLQPIQLRIRGSSFQATSKEVFPICIRSFCKSLQPSQVWMITLPCSTCQPEPAVVFEDTWMWKFVLQSQDTKERPNQLDSIMICTTSCQKGNHFLYRLALANSTCVPARLKALLQVHNFPAACSSRCPSSHTCLVVVQSSTPWPQPREVQHLW